MSEEMDNIMLASPVTIIATKVCTQWEHKLPLKSCFVCYNKKRLEEGVKKI